MDYIKRTMIMQALIKKGWIFGVNHKGILFMEHKQLGCFIFKDENDFENVLDEINIH